MQTDTTKLETPVRNNLSDLRGDKSVIEVAKAVEVTRNAIYKMERGETAPKTKTLMKLIDLYKKPIIYYPAEK